MKKIIVAPLNWGLGHVSRCVPIIELLLENNFTPVLASDGKALEFLNKAFPDLESFNLPSYNISYGKNLQWKLFLQIPKIVSAVKNEQKVIAEFIDKDKEVVGVISDNRFGVRSCKVPSIYITHQINVFSGSTTFLTSYIHQKIIKKFDECWIPDTPNSTFSGKLSSTKINSTLKYIGVLSRFKKENLDKTIDVLLLISGPEPNRTFLEDTLKSAFKNDKRNIVFVLGKVEEVEKKWAEENIIFYNFLLTDKLEKLINSAKIVVCRSGYSSIMDLSVLEKKVFFIPTKNQPEQAYLANYLTEKRMAPQCSLKDFSVEKLLEDKDYKGLKSEEIKLNSNLFSLFHSKRKF
ncbi:glycosyltransferase [Polaribacter sp. SA4-10]|uniref:glycosyltransferase n=1 Tax=Polaribacter sp. SA4-10 TaxID=754397 RepID=UPI000B57E2A3|nr:glycosyltransferase [Polaribacter sp. SA4-10]ARV07288.1 glycosyltransferase [Polaribacter sp. SA4-10]